MKHFLLISFLVWGCSQLHAQTTVTFGYNAAGNRTSAHHITLRSAATMQATDSISDEIRKAEEEGISNELSACKVTIYPNPTDGEVLLVISDAREDAVSEIKVYSSSGQFLMQQKATGNATVPVDLSNSPNGYYLLHFRHGENNSSYTIIKQ